MHTLGITTSVCPSCSSLVPAKIVAEDNAIYFVKFCREHGESRAFIRSNIQDYLRTLRFVKPAWQPDRYNGNSKARCPDGCGLCSRHEQHLCMPIVEITTRCDLACPICINSSGEANAWDMSLDEFRIVLDNILAAEHQIDVLNLSGGEPFLHPRILDLIDEAVSRKQIVRVSISTNGLVLLRSPQLVRDLAARRVVVSLQFDGDDDAVYQTLRGRTLRDEKEEIIKLLGDAGITTTLTMTLAGGVNDTQIPAMLDRLFSTPHVVSLMIQPLAFTGRASSISNISRLSIPDVIRLLDRAGQPHVKFADFVPLPCSHPLCFSLAFYLMTDAGRAVSINQLTDAATLMDSLSNRMFFGLAESEQQRLREMIYELWSGPVGAVPDSEAILATLRRLLRDLSSPSCGCFNPRVAFTTMERAVKSIFIHAFQDADTFDLARARRCCQSYPQPDGKLIPACVHNVLRRGRP